MGINLTPEGLCVEEEACEPWTWAIPRSVTVLHVTRTVGRKWASRGHSDGAPFSLQRDRQNKPHLPLLCPFVHPWTPRMGTCVLKVDVVLHIIHPLGTFSGHWQG